MDKLGGIRCFLKEDYVVIANSNLSYQWLDFGYKLTGHYETGDQDVLVAPVTLVEWND